MRAILPIRERRCQDIDQVSLFQALSVWTIEKALFRSSSLTESLEQATIKSVLGRFSRCSLTNCTLGGDFICLAYDPIATIA